MVRIKKVRRKESNVWALNALTLRWWLFLPWSVWSHTGFSWWGCHKCHSLNPPLALPPPSLGSLLGEKQRTRMCRYPTVSRASSDSHPPPHLQCERQYSKNTERLPSVFGSAKQTNSWLQTRAGNRHRTRIWIRTWKLMYARERLVSHRVCVCV